jgi:Protein kinase domain
VRAFSALLPDVHGYVDAVEIGRGGFAVVYRARRTALDQIVAVKVLQAAELDAVALARFDRERIAMGALAHHPHIVTVYDGGTTPRGVPYLVMEYVQGGSLADELRRSGPLPVERVLDAGVRLAGAVETAHRAGVLHRDIKPANVLVSRYGQPLLADFGISRIRGAHLTESGVITASIAHAPPEVLDGKPPSPRSDVYSLASTLFCLLSGHPPFVHADDESALPAVARLFRDPVPDIPWVAPPVMAVLRDGMAKDPARRPGSALEFGERLRDAQRALGLAPSTPDVEGAAAPRPVHAPAAGVPVEVTRPPIAHTGHPGVVSTQVGTATRPRRHRWILAVGAAVVVAAAAGVTAMLGFGQPAASVPVAPTSVAPVAADVKLKPLLLPLTALGTGAGVLAPPTDDVGIVGACPRQAVRTGLVDEAATTLTSPTGAVPDIHVDAHVARFAPHTAEAFMASVRDVAGRCVSASRSVETPPAPPPAGAQEAVRLRGEQADLVWARRGDVVVLIHVNFFGSLAVSHPGVAPDLAAQAVDTVIKGTS